MILLGLGIGALGLLLWAANAFSRASVASLKALLAWVVALGGLALGAMLLLTGRGASAIAAGVFLGPLAWSWWQEAQGKGKPRPDQARRGRMGRAEALEVLDLTDPVAGGAGELVVVEHGQATVRLDAVIHDASPRRASAVAATASTIAW